MDYAKERYGGPFTTSDVEDVKTFIRVFLMLPALGLIFVLIVPILLSCYCPLSCSHLFLIIPPFPSGTNPEKPLLNSHISCGTCLLSSTTITMYGYRHEIDAKKYKHRKLREKEPFSRSRVECFVS